MGQRLSPGQHPPPGHSPTPRRPPGPGQRRRPHPAPTAAAPTPHHPQPRTPQDRHHKATPWPEAREIAARAGRGGARRAPVSLPRDSALGLTLAAPLAALTDLPSFDTSAMDGWAVAGPGPWDVRDNGVLAGHAEHARLDDGEAVRIATGARIPPDTTAVLRSEHGRTDDRGRLHATRDVSHGQDIRPRGQECRSGDQLLPPGTLVTPAVLGLAAAAGYDTLTAVPRPRADVLVLGDELLTEGLPHDGLIRDALGPMLPPWLRALGAEVTTVRRIGDDADALHEAITASDADLVVTTGGTASGPVDHVHPTLRRIGAELLVNGVKVRPGHPMLLARTKENQHLVGLPGNPLAAVSGLLTLAEPLLRTLAARPAQEPYALPLQEAVHGHPYDTRLIPVVVRADRAVPLHYNGPAMLRGVAAADALAVVPPGGARPGQAAEVLDLPWAAAGIGVCFT
ncbi:molybdopterin molybdotransferase MoeA [Streptomyces spinoverrucosus]|uniref:molybdopterin molybdotransferase MoeA n=1 Tax=Streptomyces spinoverrucosus TaxID=284043 RepID=UPI0018C3BBC9|nr:molybdopterin molybdotransferase MoeA [Streptomyces spinoverrucosus]MBG0853838.1 molybdopterin molybdotransferase MoeA [Streptomyces spinoverrucosus]